MDKPLYLRRPNILPKKSSEYPLLLFVSLIIPATYWFEIWVVLPSLFSDSPLIYWMLFIFGHFVLHNVVGNFLGILLFDTSIRGRKMPNGGEPGVKYCNQCETFTPPRSFHCPICDICILKRDHHCIFTSCCVGFYNHRFFVLFVFYVTLAALLSLPFNLYFLSDRISTSSISYFFMLICPILLLFKKSTSQNIELKDVYFIIFAISIVGACFTLVWLYVHLKLILKGTVVYEMKKCINIYNLGPKKNLQLVFGTKWYLSWISPYIKSPLTCDGITFPIKKDSGATKNE